MSNQLITMSKARTILRLYTQGVSKSSISARTGVSRNTVKKYIRDFILLGSTFEEVNTLPDADLEQLFLSPKPEGNKPRYDDLIAFFPDMDKALKSRGITREKQWEAYLEKYPEGYRKSQFFYYYNKWSKRSKAVMHIEHKSADKMYVDYAGQKLSYIDAETAEIVSVEVFVSVLGASQLTYVEASLTQKKEEFIQSCENSLHYYGGSPQAIVPDNLKSAVFKSSKYEPTLNEMFHDFCNHYSMTALPAAPYKPTHKALVEGMVKIIYQCIYINIKAEEHFSLDSLNKSIRNHLDELNNRLFSNRPYSRRMLFEEVEKQEMQPLPAYRYEARKKHIATVMKNNHVYLSEDKHYYSVPYRYIGKKVVLLYNAQQVDVYYHYELIASHIRNPRPYGYTTKEEHLASQNKFQSDWTPEKFILRAESIGEATKEYITQVLSTRRHPEYAYRMCQGILNYASRVGALRLNKACERALYYGEYSYLIIRSIIEKGLDKTEIDPSGEHREMPVHENIRGQFYYQ
jgi:transposase